MSLLEELNELCPNCGDFVDQLNNKTGFCYECSGVGDSSESPTQSKRVERLELWLAENADTIEFLMLEEQIAAKVAIRQIAENTKPHCQCCGGEMPHTTAGRHIFCTKNEKCRKARRYYKYLVYEKNKPKDEARRTALLRFAN